MMHTAVDYDECLCDECNKRWLEAAAKGIKKTVKKRAALK